MKSIERQIIDVEYFLDTRRRAIEKGDLILTKDRMLLEAIAQLTLAVLTLTRKDKTGIEGDGHG